MSMTECRECRWDERATDFGRDVYIVKLSRSGYRRAIAAICIRGVGLRSEWRVCRRDCRARPSVLGDLRSPFRENGEGE